MRIHLRRKLLGIILGLVALPTLSAMDNAHYYKIANFEGLQSHNTKNWFNQLDIKLQYGAARSGYDFAGHKSSVLDTHGNQNMLYLVTGVPATSDVDVTDYRILAANLVNHSQNNSNFGKLSFNGKFSLLEADFSIRQNLAAGFFLEAQLPLRTIKVDNISYTDLSPETGMYSQQNRDWIRLLKLFNNVLNAYDMKNYDSVYEKTGLGELSIMVGWQYEDKKTFDFLQFLSLAFRLGLLFPTDSKADVSYAFPVSTGYDQHWGLPLRFDLNIGALSWLTFGAYTGVQFFFNKTYNNRMKTNANQSGFIKLAEGQAKTDFGAMWDIGLDAKFDHFYKGLSFLLGYSYTNKGSNDLTPSNTTIFSSSTVNSDSGLYTWRQHVIHLLAEYDFGVHIKSKKWGARLNAFYDFPIGGKNIFSTNMYGGGIGLDLQF